MKICDVCGGNEMSENSITTLTWEETCEVCREYGKFVYELGLKPPDETGEQYFDVEEGRDGVAWWHIGNFTATCPNCGAVRKVQYEIDGSWNRSDDD